MSEPTITRVEPLRPRGLRARVHLSRGEPLEVALEALERLSLGAGDALPSHRRHHLINADADVRVRDAALNLLSHRARTRSELRKKLLDRGHSGARIEACLRRLEDRGLLDDRAVASAFVRDRLRFRPRGPRRLSAELRAKGISADVAADVIADVLEEQEISETDLAVEAARQWLSRQGSGVVRAMGRGTRSPESEKARRRLRGYLGRRGFGGEPLREAMEAAREAAGPDSDPGP
jgi:regulatory protein